MKALKLFFAIIGIVVSCSMYGSQMSKQHKTTRQEWQKFHNFDSNAPKLPAPALSQKLPEPPIYGTIVQFMHGDGKTARTPYQAVANFENAHNMAQQSRNLGAPLPLNTFYNFSRKENEITQQVYDGLMENPDQRTLLVSVETLHKISSSLPAKVKYSFPNTVTVKVEKSVEEKIEYLVTKAAKGGTVGAGTAAIVSLAENSPRNALKETEKVLWANKNHIAKEAFERSCKVITNHGVEAIDRGLKHAAEQLDKTDFGTVGEHCYYESFPEQKFFSDTAKHAGSVLKDEFIRAGIEYGIELALEHAPGAILQTSNISIDPDDVCYGTAIGACAGLGYGIWTMDDPIAEIPLHDI